MATSPQGGDEGDEEDAMDEDVDLSSVNDGASQSCDEGSAMLGDNCAPVSNL